MSNSLRWRLGAFMFLHYAAGGAWMPIFALYLQRDLALSVGQIAFLFALMPVARMGAPLVGGQLADRHFHLQRLLGVLYLLCGGLLYLMSRGGGFGLFCVWVFLMSAVGSQLDALSTTLAFRHLPDPERNFGPIRVWGTIGWIVPGWALTAWRLWHGVHGGADAFLFAAGLCAALALFTLALPSSPPSKSGIPWAFLGAFRLLRNRNFLVFMGLAFVASSQMQYFAQISAPYLVRIGVSAANLPAVLTISQVSEIVAMAWLLPRALPRLGIRNCLLIGAAAWPVRCLIYSLGQPLALVLGSLALTGVSFTFFTIVGQVYINRMAGPDIQASAQSLLILVSSGLGSFLGAFLAGAVQAHFSVGQGAAQAVDYSRVFVVPAAVLLAGVAVFWALFREVKEGYGAAAG